MVVGDDPSFGSEAGDALNFGPTGRMGVPHLVHEQIFRNRFVKQDEKLEGGARVRASGKPCSAFEEKEKTKSWENVRILQVSTIVRQNFYQEEHHFDAKK